MRSGKLVFSRSLFSYLLGVIIILAVYAVYRILVSSNSQPLLPFFQSILDSWLWIVEQPSKLILNWLGSPVTLNRNMVFTGNNHIGTIRYEVLMKNWLIVFLTIVWLTNTPLKNKVVFTVILLVINMLASSLTIYILSHLISYDYDYNNASRVARTPGILLMIFVLYIWIRHHMAAITISLSKFRLNAGFIENKIFEVFMVLCVYVIIRYFIVGFFDFRIWTTILFSLAQKILGIIGYESFHEPFYLIGYGGSVFADKDCLGISTMILFSFVVYLTGASKSPRWLYIGLGLFILNAINIVRFVVLFVHLEKYGDSLTIIHVHNIYNYFIYAVIFVLWVIWFEKYSDIKANIWKKA